MFGFFRRGGEFEWKEKALIVDMQGWHKAWYDILWDKMKETEMKLYFTMFLYLWYIN